MSASAPTPPTKLAASLCQWIGHQRFIYNAKVREKHCCDRFAKSSLALTGLKPLPDQAYSQFIGEVTSFLREVSAQILRNGAYRFANGCARRLARQQIDSRRRLKTKCRLRRLGGYGREVRKDFAHKVSFALANSPAQVLVLEDLKLKHMTAAPAPKVDAAGRYTRNGAAAKAGLNQALLSCSLGQVSQFLTYKAARRNKLVLKSPAAHSSNECTRCGHCDNADHNTSCVIKSRGIGRLRAGMVLISKKKAARVRGRNDIAVGPVRPKPGSPSCRTPVENASDARYSRTLWYADYAAPQLPAS